jgi:hypothetical protein
MLLSEQNTTSEVDEMVPGERNWLLGASYPNLKANIVGYQGEAQKELLCRVKSSFVAVATAAHAPTA